MTELPEFITWRNKKVLIPTEAIITHAVNNIAEGSTVTQADFRANLAIQYGADMTCPVTTARVIKKLGYSIPLERLLLSKSLSASLDKQEGVS